MSEVNSLFQSFEEEVCLTNHAREVEPCTCMKPSGVLYTSLAIVLHLRVSEVRVGSSHHLDVVPQGWAEQAPYDAIHVGAAAAEVPI